jgi:hypothetical protein
VKKKETKKKDCLPAPAGKTFLLTGLALNAEPAKKILK